MSAGIEEQVRAAWSARGELHRGDDDAYRVLHGWGEGVPGFDVDRYGDVLRIEYRRDLAAMVPEVLAALDRMQAFTRVVAGVHGGRDAADALRGSPPGAGEWQVVREQGLRFAVEPARAGNPGLYLDARPARAWLRAHADGRRVLNLFAFTGSLGVTAAVGGARVTHVDSSASALDWCRRNSEQNGVAIDQRDLARMNIYQHIRRAQARRQRYGGIILDPPPSPASPRPGDRTPGQRGVMALVSACAEMLEPGGWLLCFFHHRLDRSHDELDAEVLTASGSPLEVVWRGTSGPDFPEQDERRKLRLTAFVRRG